MLYPSSYEKVGLLETIHGTDPAFAMCMRHLPHWLNLASIPEIDWPILAGSHKLFLIDCAYSINRVIMALVDDFGLFFCFPGNDLMVTTTTQKILTIKTINVKCLSGVLVKGLDQSSLRNIPVFDTQIRRDRAQTIRVLSKLDSINMMLMACQGMN